MTYKLPYLAILYGNYSWNYWKFYYYLESSRTQKKLAEGINKQRSIEDWVTSTWNLWEVLSRLISRHNGINLVWWHHKSIWQWKIASQTGNCKVCDLLPLLKPKILPAIEQIVGEKTLSDVEAVPCHIVKTETFSV